MGEEEGGLHDHHHRVEGDLKQCERKRERERRRTIILSLSRGVHRYTCRDCICIQVTSIIGV